MIKVFLALVLTLTVAPLALPGTSAERFSKCLPAEIDPGSPVVIPSEQSSKRRATNSPTVKSRLIQLKASCKKGKLFASGKPVYFYNLIGCWGNPPADYLDLLKQQSDEIRRLQKKYTVIQISCAASADPRRVS
ncbi:MAG TPA: hypothetical protein VLL54_03155 [Pyrinomonadaceae bacterium]|nr:hypothetical protein [Pyrinomonadaceae bacterium]